MDRGMRNLPCERLELDECWTFIRKKGYRMTENDDPAISGDRWVWLAMDPDSKAIPCFHLGRRRVHDARTFVADIASRMRNRVQISTDALGSYVTAIEAGFGGDVDYGTVVKTFESEPQQPGRYAPPRVAFVRKSVVMGDPDPAKITTSHVERANLHARMQVKRMARLTLAHSKREPHLRAALNLHTVSYNFLRIHSGIRATPAMRLGVTNRLWKMDEIVRLAALESGGSN
jgi:IS1 family transposase